MSTAANWVPTDMDVAVPSAARVYDYLLGGAHNFDADRMVGEKVLAVQPNGRQIARSNRAFMSRAVRFMVSEGITQFLDLGSGIPTVGNVHEIAQHADPDSRIVYVDYDPVAVAHSQLILEFNPLATVVAADLTDPQAVLKNSTVRNFLDFSKPIGLLMVAVFHFVADDKQPSEIVKQYVEAIPSGSYVAISHLTADQMADEMAGVVEAMKNSRDPMYFRSYAEVAELFDGLDVVEPGVVSAPLWRKDYGDDLDQEGVYAGVGRKA
ncbi:MAG TPA: SAM-dependent methyltransferase [Pseudonocardiaceae bacterium]|nr:SAM-dependent methyltransferase [Pseudonocardiaceae bacterium]